MGLKCSLLCKWTNDAPQLFTSSSLKVKPIENFFYKSSCAWLISQAHLLKNTYHLPYKVTKPKASQRELTTA